MSRSSTIFAEDWLREYINITNYYIIIGTGRDYVFKASVVLNYLKLSNSSPTFEIVILCVISLVYQIGSLDQHCKLFRVVKCSL